jgi:hypothetical protein
MTKPKKNGRERHLGREESGMSSDTSYNNKDRGASDVEVNMKANGGAENWWDIGMVDMKIMFVLLSKFRGSETKVAKC